MAILSLKISMTIEKKMANRKNQMQKWFGWSLVLSALCVKPVLAQHPGVSTLGVTGGLVIPSAEVLPLGTLAFSYGNYQEPQLGTAFSTQQNLSFGLGLLQNVELFGRFANYNTPVPGSIILANGIRDLSANLKVRLPTPWTTGPRIAIGVNDIAGGAINFKAAYVVASEQFGPLGASLGYAKGSANLPTFDGAFGGLSLRMGDTGLSALAEHDGQQKHAGLRWVSPQLTWLSQAQIAATVQRSFGAVAPSGLEANASRFAITLQVPLQTPQEGSLEKRDFKPAPADALPDIDAKPDPLAMQPTPDDRLDALRKALVAAGLEGVRVGLRSNMGSVLVVEYENHRYAHNEADALGLVFGLGAEMAPPGTKRVLAVTFKQGLRLYETSAGVAEYRTFLRDGPASHVRDSLVWDRQPSDRSEQTRWIDSAPSATSRVRIEVKPDLNYTLGTEVGAFDYALAANIKLMAPLWKGAQLYTGFMVPVDHSDNMDDGAVFSVLRQRGGLKTVALQQSFWLGERVLSQVAAGRFHYNTTGVQAETALFMPNSDDLLRLRGAGYNQNPGALAGQDLALAASYRHMLTPSMSLEAGVQRFSDGSRGPSIEWNRWFGDVGVQIYFRKGDDAKFAGLQMSFPLTPRKGMAPGPVFFTGTSQQVQGIRTRLTTAGQPANLVQPGAVRDIQLETSLDATQLNAGRLSRDYLVSQLYRMREAFFIFRNTSQAK